MALLRPYPASAPLRSRFAFTLRPLLSTLLPGILTSLVSDSRSLFTSCGIPSLLLLLLSLLSLLSQAPVIASLTFYLHLFKLVCLFFPCSSYLHCDCADARVCRLELSGDWQLSSFWLAAILRYPSKDSCQSEWRLPESDSKVGLPSLECILLRQAYLQQASTCNPCRSNLRTGNLIIDIYRSATHNRDSVKSVFTTDWYDQTVSIVLLWELWADDWELYGQSLLQYSQVYGDVCRLSYI